MHGIGDLALALGGSEDSFTGKLLQLIAKADPDNRERLRLGFPRIVRGWEIWMATSPTPTAAELLDVLDQMLEADINVAIPSFLVELPGLAQEIDRKASPGRPFRELSESGLLWLINAIVFHPRGFALGMSMDTWTGEVTGWDVLGAGAEPWRYADDMNERFAAAEATLASYREGAANGG